MRRSGVALVVVGAALSWLGCGGSGGKSEAKAVTLHATRSALRKIPQSQQPPGPGGDAFIVSDDIAGGGHVDAYCVASPRPKTEWCSVTVVRPRGQVTGSGIFVNAPKLSGAIPLLSGSGAYEGAVGSLATSGLTDSDESVTIRVR
jgi:hypothetical protein